MSDLATPTLGIEQRAQSALAASPIFALRDLNVELSEDSLLIYGRVDTYYHKQLAQEVVRAVAGNCRVENKIHVD